MAVAASQIQYVRYTLVTICPCPVFAAAAPGPFFPGARSFFQESAARWLVAAARRAVAPCVNVAVVGRRWSNGRSCDRFPPIFTFPPRLGEQHARVRRPVSVFTATRSLLTIPGNYRPFKLLYMHQLVSIFYLNSVNTHVFLTQSNTSNASKAKVKHRAEPAH